MKDIIIIREINKDEYNYASIALFNAIYAPNEKIERDIIYQPDIYCYIDNFKREDDICLVALFDNKPIGMAWSRIIYSPVRGFGNIDEKTPELAISIEKEFRNKGIGQRLLNELFILLKNNKYEKISLSVAKENPALKLYEKCGFKIIKENSEDYIMLKLL